MERIQQPDHNVFLKGVAMKMLTNLFGTSLRTQLAVTGLIVVFLFLVIVCWLTMRTDTGPLPSSKNQRYLGEQIAEQIKQVLPQGRVVLLVLFPAGLEPYDSCIQALKSSLPPGLQIIGQVYPIDEGIYNDDDYTAGIDETLGRYPQAELLCIISAGSVSHAAISSRLTSFLEIGGKLVLVGQIIRRDSPFVYLAAADRARIIARRSGWLKKTMPYQAAPSSDSVKDYYQQHYVVLPD